LVAYRAEYYRPDPPGASIKDTSPTILAHRALAAALAAHAAPATPELLGRKSALEPHTFGGTIPLLGVAEELARLQVRRGLAAPFPANDLLGYPIVWHMPDETWLATVDGRLLPVPADATEESEYGKYLAARHSAWMADADV
jgi:hypothetical protein